MAALMRRPDAAIVVPTMAACVMTTLVAVACASSWREHQKRKYQSKHAHLNPPLVNRLLRTHNFNK
jgi:hypothetical protein